MTLLRSLIRDVRDVFPRTSIVIGAAILDALTAIIGACEHASDVAMVLADVDNEEPDASEVDDPRGVN